MTELINFNMSHLKNNIARINNLLLLRGTLRIPLCDFA